MSTETWKTCEKITWKIENGVCSHPDGVVAEVYAVASLNLENYCLEKITKSIDSK